jgi:hypothetical protein
MEAAVTLEEEPAGGPRLSLLDLRGLFEDLPTIPLVEALCARACRKGSTAPVNNIGDLIHSMYDVPAGRDSVAWLEEELSREHVQMLRHGVTTWRLGR